MTDERMPPMFSVIIPVHNASAVVATSLASLRGQTLDDFEVVVIDDGSTDETGSVVQSFRDDFPMTVLHQDNRGAATARNAGATVARGRYFLFLDADDEAKPQWLERIAEPVAEGAPTVICCGFELSEGSSTLYRRPYDLGAAFYGYRGLFIPGTYALRRDLFEGIGGFADALPYGEHTELALRITSYGCNASLTIATIEEPLIIKHHDRSPEVVSRYDRARLAGAIYSIDTHGDQLRRAPHELADYHAVAGVASARLGEYSVARYHLWKAFGLRRQPRDLARYALSLIPGLASRMWLRHSR